MKPIRFLLLPLSFIVFISCGNDDNSFTYNGRAETEITKITAKVAGTVDQITCDEGDAVKQGQLLVKINTDKLDLQLKQQQAQERELDANLRSISAQEKQINSQMALSKQTLEKTKKMVSEGAATQQKQDELETQVEVFEAQLESALTNKKVIQAKKDQLAAAIGLTQLSLNDAVLKAPFDGIITNRFLEETELAAPGRTILELADLSRMEVTFYVDYADLNRVKIGEPIKVHIDGADKSMEGKIKWIASESEFTPKTILTKETRTTLVYAVKISVANPDGILKIGMPVDVTI
jgi:HlyD family secretion protein